MAERKVYSCDWCGVDSPLGSSIPCEWAVVQDTDCGYPAGHLCPSCKAARVDAITGARANCFRAAHPLPSTRKDGGS